MDTILGISLILTCPVSTQTQPPPDPSPTSPHFNKLMRRKWLSSPEALDGIVGTLGAQALALRRMQDEPYQALVAELHRRALVEYVRPLLRGRLRCSSARTRSRVAGRLREDAAQLQRLFRRLESQASWLDAVVPHLAEVLQLEDTPSIQVEVGVLVRDYPDISLAEVSGRSWHSSPGFLPPGQGREPASVSDGRFLLEPGHY
ncbi:Exocyst complex component 3-like protein 2 [Saguinus oedipus]|uniref:Exocyst complex component 3-like protein 2 n=1 Tax=Saguinus oedipus TaxID=9490 RepID=A0ABQ9TV57_SAGOE|nr:Exocyst complex component 3-like protein 2 [Saguinus oedipus]